MALCYKSEKQIRLNPDQLLPDGFCPGSGFVLKLRIV